MLLARFVLFIALLGALATAQDQTLQNSTGVVCDQNGNRYRSIEAFNQIKLFLIQLELTECPTIYGLGDPADLRDRFEAARKEEDGLNRLIKNLTTTVDVIGLANATLAIRDAIVVGVPVAVFEELGLVEMGAYPTISTILGPGLNSALPFLEPAVRRAGVLITDLNGAQIQTLKKIAQALADLFTAASDEIQERTNNGPLATTLVKVFDASSLFFRARANIVSINTSQGIRALAANVSVQPKEYFKDRLAGYSKRFFDQRYVVIPRLQQSLRVP